MAHSCPICDSYCTCGGDIDDIQLNGSDEEENCSHCEGIDEDDDWEDEEWDIEDFPDKEA